MLVSRVTGKLGVTEALCQQRKGGTEEAQRWTKLCSYRSQGDMSERSRAAVSDAGLLLNQDSAQLRPLILNAVLQPSLGSAVRAGVSENVPYAELKEPSPTGAGYLIPSLFPLV